MDKKDKILTKREARALCNLIDGEKLEANKLLMDKSTFYALKSWEAPVVVAALIVLERIYGHRD